MSTGDHPYQNDVRWGTSAADWSTTSTTSSITYSQLRNGLQPDTSAIEAKLRNLEERLDEEHRDVIVQCQFCATWGASKTTCRSCGHPLPMGKTFIEKTEERFRELLSQEIARLQLKQ
jgi:hypothetical protein